MTREEFLEKKNPVEINVFRLKTEYKKNVKTVHCFYEGKDNLFYRGFVENEFPEYKYYYYTGNGKESVFNSYKEIEKKSLNWKNYNKNRILFFTDKDVDNYTSKPIVKDENIFETKYYSIENYLVDENIFERILTETYELDIETEINNYKTQFMKNLETFYKETQYISSWIINNRKKNINSPLKKVKMSDLFNFEHKNDTIELVMHSDYKEQDKIHEYLREKTKLSDNISVNISDIEAIKEDLNENPKNYTRGKFELWFFMAFFNTFNNKLIPVYNKTIKDNKLNKTKLKADNTISNNERAIERFVAKLVQPNDLKVFLQLNYQKLN